MATAVLSVAQISATCQSQLSAGYFSIIIVEQVVANSTPFLTLLDLQAPSHAFSERFVWGDQLGTPHLMRIAIHVATRHLLRVVATTCFAIELVNIILKQFFSIIKLCNPLTSFFSANSNSTINLPFRQANLATEILCHSSSQVGSCGANVPPFICKEDHRFSCPGD